MIPADVDAALSFCTHLVYGHAGIHAENFKLISLNENLDLDTGHKTFREMTTMKKRYPGLKVLLSVGTDADYGDDKEKYLTMVRILSYYYITQ